MNRAVRYVCIFGIILSGLILAFGLEVFNIFIKVKLVKLFWF